MSKELKILCILLLFHLVNNLIWLSIDGHQALGCEGVYHLQRAYEIHAQSNQTYPLGFSWISQIKQKVFPTVPSGFALIIVLLSHLLFIPFSYIAIVNTVNLAALLVATYLIGSYIKNKTIGILAATLLSFYPMVYGMSRKSIPELALCAAIAFFMLFLLKSNSFQNLKHTIFTALAGIIGIAIQPLFIAFAIGPYIYTVLSIRNSKEKARFPQCINAIVCLVLLLLAIPITYQSKAEVMADTKETYTEMLSTLSTRSDNFVGNADKGKTDLFLFSGPDDSCPCTQTAERGLNLKCFLFYITQLGELLGPFFCLLLIFGAMFYLKDKKVKAKAVFLFWIILPYIMLSLLPKKWGRFYTPAFAALAIITAYGLALLKLKKKHIKLFIVSTLVISLGQFFYYSYKRPSVVPWLSTLNEAINAHTPYPTNYNSAAKQISQTTLLAKDIGLCDLVQSSNRFSNHWNNDLTYYFQTALSAEHKTINLINLHWGFPAETIQKENYSYLVVLHDKNTQVEEKLKENNFTLKKQFDLIPADIMASVYKAAK